MMDKVDAPIERDSRCNDARPASAPSVPRKGLSNLAGMVIDEMVLRDKVDTPIERDSRCNDYRPASAPPVPRKGLPNLAGMVIDERVLRTINGEDRPLKSNGNTISGTRVQFRIDTHSLRWNKDTNEPRLIAHHHPLRLVHSKHLYNGGSYICDIDKRRYDEAGYVFNCLICGFDICLCCVAKPCFTCTEKRCNHTQIKIEMV